MPISIQSIIPITDLQQATRKYVEQVRQTGEPIVITQRGRPAAVLSSAQEFEGYLLALEEMSYPDWKEKLERAERELAAGRGTTLEAYERKRARRRRRA